MLFLFFEFPFQFQKTGGEQAHFINGNFVITWQLLFKVIMDNRILAEKKPMRVI